MTERYQIRLNLPAKLHHRLESGAQEAGYSVPGYIQHLLINRTDDRAAHMLHASAFYSVVSSLLHLYSVDGQKRDQAAWDKVFYDIGRTASDVLGDPPRRPDYVLTSPGTTEGESIVFELARVIRRFTASEGQEIAASARRKRCLSCNQNLPWG